MSVVERGRDSLVIFFCKWDVGKVFNTSITKAKRDFDVYITEFYDLVTCDHQVLVIIA